MRLGSVLLIWNWVKTMGHGIIFRGGKGGNF
jgi:hypothetical protein